MILNGTNSHGLQCNQKYDRVWEFAKLIMETGSAAIPLTFYYTMLHITIWKNAKKMSELYYLLFTFECVLSILSILLNITFQRIPIRVTSLCLIANQLITGYEGLLKIFWLEEYLRFLKYLTTQIVTVLRFSALLIRGFSDMITVQRFLAKIFGFTLFVPLIIYCVPLFKDHYLVPYFGGFIVSYSGYNDFIQMPVIRFYGNFTIFLWATLMAILQFLNMFRKSYGFNFIKSQATENAEIRLSVSILITNIFLGLHCFFTYKLQEHLIDGTRSRDFETWKEIDSVFILLHYLVEPLLMLMVNQKLFKQIWKKSDARNNNFYNIEMIPRRKVQREF